jgi:DNA-binding transcriptional MerR regulator/methylmalonyl-CoA mutase cobalamin-binding subunit
MDTIIILKYMDTYRIQHVAKLTGLSKDVIRIWERRFGFISPLRGTNRYRLYTDEDIALLRYLKKETEKGISIGDLAGVGREELLSRIPKSEPLIQKNVAPYEEVIEGLLKSLQPIDSIAFERKLNESIAILPFEEALIRILIPLQYRVGDLWHEGKLEISTEHFVTKLVQQKLFSSMNQLSLSEIGPKVIIGCPPGERHELGAQAIAYTCMVQGCNVHFLGGDVPIDSLASICLQSKASVAILSITIPLSESESNELILQLQQKVMPICPVWVGGRGVLKIKSDFEHHNIVVIEPMSELKNYLSRYLLKP